MFTVIFKHIISAFILFLKIHIKPKKLNLYQMSNQ